MLVMSHTIFDMVLQSHPLLWWYMIGVSNIVMLLKRIIDICPCDYHSLALTIGQEVRCCNTTYTRAAISLSMDLQVDLLWVSTVPYQNSDRTEVINAE